MTPILAANCARVRPLAAMNCESVMFSANTKAVSEKQAPNANLVLDSVADHQYRIGMSRLRELRTAAGLSQKQLADKSGVSQPEIQRFEKGERPITQRAAVKLAKPLHISPQELLPPIKGSIDELLADADPAMRDAIRQLAIVAAKR